MLSLLVLTFTLHVYAVMQTHTVLEMMCVCLSLRFSEIADNILRIDESKTWTTF